jgi:hypothetical protein
VLELEDAPELGCCVVEPAPAEPLTLEEPDGAGAALEDDEEPPLALSFFWISIEVDEELEPEGAAVFAGALVVPEAELEDEPGALVAPEPDGEVVVEDEDAPAGARVLLSVLSQPARAAAPNASEIERAKVESFMRPPWLGYRY